MNKKLTTVLYILIVAWVTLLIIKYAENVIYSCNPVNPNGLYGAQCDYENDTQYFHAVLGVSLQIRANAQQICAIFTKGNDTDFVNCVIVQVNQTCFDTYEDTDTRALAICTNYAGVLDFGWQYQAPEPDTSIIVPENHRDEV